GTTPCPGTCPRQAPEGPGHGQGQGQEEATDRDADGGARGRAQGHQRRRRDGGDDHAGRDQEGVTAQGARQAGRPATTGPRRLCWTWHLLSVRVSGPGRTGRSRDGRGCGGGVHERVPCCRVSEAALASVIETLASPVRAREARTV